MPIFELIEIEGLPPEPVVSFFKLKRKEKCIFDEFCEKIEKNGNHSKDLDKIQSLIVLLSTGTKVPGDKCCALKHRPKGDPYPDFELRVNRLRVYFFEDVEEGKIIVLGELKKGKKTQTKAIKKMRKWKMDYFQDKSSTEDNNQDQ